MAARPAPDARRWLAPLLLVIVPLALLGRALSHGGVAAPLDALLLMEPWRSECAREFPDFREVQTPMLDCATQYHPWRMLCTRTLRAGEIPLWSRDAFCGTPMLANQQSAVLYPPNLLFWLLGPRWAYTLGACLALALATGFAYGLAREIGCSRSGSALAALGFAGNGWILVWLCYMGPVNSFLWAPAGMWAVLRHARTRSPWALGGIAGACAMAILGGHAQAGLYALLAIAATALFAHHERRTALRGLAPALGAMAVGIALASAQVLPTLELAGLNYRVGQAPEPPRGLQLRQLNVLIAPWAHGNPAWLSDGLYADYRFHNGIETTGYVGVGCLVLAAIALAVGSGRIRWLLAALAAAGVVGAIEGPHQQLVRALLPPLSQMANIGRSLCLYGLALPLLAALGYEALREAVWSEERTRTRIQAATIVVALLAALGLSVSWSRLVVHEEQFARIPAGVAALAPIRSSLVLAAAATCLALLAVALVRRWPRVGLAVAFGTGAIPMLLFGWDFVPSVDARLVDRVPPTLERIAADSEHRMLALPDPTRPLGRLEPNLPTLAGAMDVQGYDSLYPRSASERLKALDAAHPEGLFVGARRQMLDRAGVRWVVARGDEPSRGEPPLVRAGPLLWENAQAWPVAWATDGPELPSEAPPAAAIRWGASTRRITTSPGGYAWISETTYPGWRAWSDGQPVALEHPENGLTRVAVGASGSVDLSYEPGSFAVGGFVTLATLGALAGAACFVVCREGRRPRAS